MKKVLATLIVSFILLFQVTPAFCANLDIDAASYILMDAKTGSVLYEYKPDLKWRPASTTKIATALVALKEGKLDQMMTASNEAVSDIGVGGMNIGIMPGEQMSLNNLLHALLIVSANETANIISENLFNDKTKFLAEMNKFAADAGAKNTTFTNPCGIDEYEKDADHFSSARDLALIAKECLKYPLFREIIGQKQLSTLPATNKHKTWNILNNTNKLLGKSFKYGPETGDDRNQYTITGLKTGSTSRAGANFISSAVNKDGLELISVVLGVNNKPNRSVFDFTKTLLKAGYENYSRQMIIDRSTKIQEITVKDAADGDKVDLITNGVIEALLPNDKTQWQLDKKINIRQDVKAPVKKGTVLGSIEYTREGVSLGKVDIVSSRTVEQTLKSKSKDYVKGITSTSLFKYIVIGVILVICFFILRFILRKISRKRKYKLRNFN
ncbi:peptidase S11 D-alanyl-D-alanine carboxypeptidase 1 [Ruminiclostridium papyrosolvens DSM 2782]|uniref:serine-type D-Ala-D-Ala carboxypeptidase n=1 Tax=Ruminiclostridium papyrosolvens DSM 2782 TaxID=588581 RepID=F1T9B5_9FIRM|nr:serine hydrolase [Ruminiclostridium papyrosolvens]EGD49097.1 peptidase S11 D-alanyl-D-alanine carboxypeptidase 1 [Ruminiclostridium papyrosolvens DSM 2782]WES35577.1 serine hydrolase [Ruminiclostridium papyrosolvens DSM 2782]